MYCSTTDVYNATLLTSTEVGTTNVTSFIQSAEAEIDNLTFTTYWNVEDSGTASSGAASTLTDSTKTWTVNAYANMYLWVYSGTGSGQARLILSNTSTAITVDSAWTTNPDNTSKYRVIYTATNPNYVKAIDGNNDNTLFVEQYPIRILQSLSINSTTVTPSYVYIYDDVGKLVIGNSAQYTFFDASLPQNVSINYWWGVYPMPANVKRAVVLLASLKTLAAQMGGTYDTPSMYTLPEGTVSVGQAYINIRGTFSTLKEEWELLKPTLAKYPHLP